MNRVDSDKFYIVMWLPTHQLRVVSSTTQFVHGQKCVMLHGPGKKVDELQYKLDHEQELLDEFDQM